MSVRRGATRVATVGAMLGGLLAVGASPALADGDQVQVRSASSFTAGGSPGTVAVEVRKRTDGCVILRTGLMLRLDGVQPQQVRVQVNSGGRWWPVPVSGRSGALATARTSPAEPNLCKGKGKTVRYRVAFLAGAPAGRLTVVGEATTAAGRLIGRAATTARVGGAKAATPTPTRTPSPTPTPSAEETTPGADDTSSAVAALAPVAGASAAAADGSSGGSPFMWLGILLVLVGAALIALLVRRNRVEKVDEQADHGSVPLPRGTGGTTYRSGGPAGQVYGQQPPAPTVYGGPTAPRPAGNVYGAAAPTSGWPGGEPPAAGPDGTSVLPRPPR
ncbi:hypothetical protein ACL02O_15255 [Micromonospora sp. MS34]|uniref:hypothetical protein n=1 Tax=Micromonospora sp. MS34 TaxID=3385971 RepID=UPI0039A2C253